MKKKNCKDLFIYLAEVPIVLSDLIMFIFTTYKSMAHLQSQLRGSQHKIGKAKILDFRFLRGMDIYNDVMQVKDA